MVSARCGCPTCDGLTARRRWKSLLVAVILFVDFVWVSAPLFVLAWIASSCGWVPFLSQRLGRVRQLDLKLDRR
jgi:hypothetical protein